MNRRRREVLGDFLGDLVGLPLRLANIPFTVFEGAASR